MEPMKLFHTPLIKTSQRIAFSLRARGLKERDTVAIMLPTTPIFSTRFTAFC